MIFHQTFRYVFLIFLFALVVPNTQAQNTDQEIKVTLRTVADEFLLQLGDSTSRILPIEKVDHRYAIHFEKEFEYVPASLLYATFVVLEEHPDRGSYIVEVETCSSHEVVHSFKVNIRDNDNMGPCQERELPKDCYVFYFTPIDENDPGTFSSGVLQPTEDNSGTFPYILAGLVLLVGGTTLVYLKRKKKGINADSDLIHIGQFQFDQKGMTLTLKAQSVELSSKEADLLSLLYANENKTLKREYILSVVWGDDGDYVGRTLDVFISKLRKKLEADPNLKIVNIRGVGYRFVIK